MNKFTKGMAQATGNAMKELPPMGEILNNGAEVWFRYDDIVLALFRCEFVVWTTNTDGDAFWGHYFRNLGDAMMCFSEKTSINMSGKTIGDIGTVFNDNDVSYL